MTRRVRSIGAAIAGLAVMLGIGRVAGEQGSTATVAGSVRLSAAAAKPLSASAYGRRGVVPKHRSSTPDIKNVIVYVEGQQPSSAPPPMRVRISQRDEQFIPQVTAISVGSTIDFPNDDPFFHNVFSLSKAKTFDLGRYPTGKSRSVTFTRPGVVKVFCDIHSHMTALVMVFDHPWFTVPADDGTFTIGSVPARELTIVAWHERIGERRERVTLSPGGTAKLAFTLPVLENTP